MATGWKPTHPTEALRHDCRRGIGLADIDPVLHRRPCFGNGARPSATGDNRVLIAGHVVEMTLSYRIAEAEQVYGRRWDDELDRHLQMGMFAMDRISADGTMGKAGYAGNY